MTDITNNGKVKKTNPFRYAVGMFGTSIPINMFKTFAASFYVLTLGLINTEQFALIVFIYTFIDAIDNPVYGFLSDRTRTRWGRRRPWLMIGTPLLVLLFIFFFSPPSYLAQGSGGALAYVLLMYILTGTLDSLVASNYGALFPELFRTESERAKANAIRQAFQFMAMILSIALTPIIANKIGFSTTAIIYGALAIAVIWFMSLGAHENPESMAQPKAPLWGSIKTILSMKEFWIYGITNAAFTAAIALVQAGVPFYVTYYIKGGSMDATILLGVAIISAIIFIPLWVKIIKKISLLPAWRISFMLLCVGIIPLAFTKNIIAAALFIVFLGFGMGGISTTMDIVAARIIDKDASKHGFRREGIYTSFIGVLNKSHGLFVSLAWLLVAKIFLFKDSTDTGPRPEDAVRFITVWFPAIMMLLAVIASRFLKFKNLPASSEEIAAEGYEEFLGADGVETEAFDGQQPLEAQQDSADAADIENTDAADVENPDGTA